MKVTAVWTGYVGLVSGARLADMGNNVFCLDLHHANIGMLQKGDVPIHEPGLDKVIASNVAAGRLRFTIDVEQSVSFSTPNSSP